jgi:predicted O-linked N-acetylglucosamine transferase (SPINDLY family)
MTTLEVAAGVAAKASDWLTAFLAEPAGLDPSIDGDRLQDRLKFVTFTELINAIEQAGEMLGAAAKINLYQRWIVSQPPGSPHLYAAWFNLAVTYSQNQLQPNAIAAYQNALVLKPDFHSAALNLGTLFESIGRSDAALETWERALQPDDVRTILLNNRARLFEQVGRLGEAEQAMRRSLLTNSGQPDVIHHWVHVRQKMCMWPILTDDVPGLSRGDLLRHAGPLAALALSDDVDVQREAARDWIARKTFPIPQSLSPSDGYRHDRIRLGYLSSDFCRHAMSYLIAELFERHDRTRFEVYGYCSSPDDGSEVRTRVIRSFDHFRIIKHIDDGQAARLIRDDEIDILIDLNGLTAGARIQILRWKPAPVQATYLGFIGPVPLPELDYMFCDQIVIPPDRAASYQPTPLSVAASYQANDSKREIGAETTRAEAGLPADKFVLCCFSNHYKTTEEIFAAWMEILRRSPNAVLWLVGDNEWARRNMVERADSSGIDPARIVFASRVGPNEYMARLGSADVFLDTFPYNAGTIASDAIRMGLPLVTMVGRSFASRMAASLLTAVGAREGIATTLQEYIDFAVRLATDEQVFSAYKRLFSPEKWQSTIGNVAAFTASYESTLLGISKRRPA